jgi:hypothetical protein
MGKVDVLCIFVVDIVSSLCGFQIDIRHLGIRPYSFPEHVALIVAQVDAMNVLACVLALGKTALRMKTGACGHRHEGEYDSYQSVHHYMLVVFRWFLHLLRWFSE